MTDLIIVTTIVVTSVLWLSMTLIIVKVILI